MRNECERFINLIPKAALDDLEPGSRAELEKHLAECETCRAEQVRYAQAIDQLVSVEDVPVPRHFFVSPESAPGRLSRFFAGLVPSWKLAGAAIGLLALLVAFLAVTHFQFKAENGVYAFSFGRPLPELDGSKRVEREIQAVRSELTGLIDQKLQAERRAHLATLAAELNRSGQRLSAEQRRVLQAALKDVETRMSDRVESTGTMIETRTGRTLQTFYDALQAQRAQDLMRIRTTMTQAQLADEQKERETRAVLSTLIEVADLRVRGLN